MHRQKGPFSSSQKDVLIHHLGLYEVFAASGQPEGFAINHSAAQCEVWLKARGFSVGKHLGLTPRLIHQTSKIGSGHVPAWNHVHFENLIAFDGVMLPKQSKVSRDHIWSIYLKKGLAEGAAPQKGEPPLRLGEYYDIGHSRKARLIGLDPERVIFGHFDDAFGREIPVVISRPFTGRLCESATNPTLTVNEVLRVVHVHLGADPNRLVQEDSLNKLILNLCRHHNEVFGVREIKKQDRPGITTHLIGGRHG